MAKQTCESCTRWDRDNQVPTERAICLWHAFPGPAPEWFDQPYKHKDSGVECAAYEERDQ